MNSKEKNKKNNPAIGRNALKFIDELLTHEEIVDSNLRVSFIGELIKVKQEERFSKN